MTECPDCGRVTFKTLVIGVTHESSWKSRQRVPLRVLRPRALRRARRAPVPPAGLFGSRSPGSRGRCMTTLQEVWPTTTATPATHLSLSRTHRVHVEVAERRQRKEYRTDDEHRSPPTAVPMMNGLASISPLLRSVFIRSLKAPLRQKIPLQNSGAIDVPLSGVAPIDIPRGNRASRVNREQSDFGILRSLW